MTKFFIVFNTLCHSGDTGSIGPVGEPGIKGTKGNHGDILNYISLDSFAL